MIKLKIVALTDVGVVREHNEDNFIINPDLGTPDWFFLKDQPYSVSEDGSLLIVADGMGGTNAGEVASRLAVDTVKDYFHSMRKIPQEEVEVVMKRVFGLANDVITKHSYEHPETDGMGTTLTIAWIRDDSVHVAWIGDSRAYMLSPGRAIQQISKDHSLVQQWIDEGKMDDEQAFYHPQNNIVTKSLGAQEITPEADYTRYPLQSNDRVLICSDGLNGMLLDAQIETIMNQGDPRDIVSASDKLVKAALEAGGKDNITLVLAYILEAQGTLSPIPRENVAVQARHVAFLEKGKTTKFNFKRLFFALLGLIVLTSLAFFFYNVLPFGNKDHNNVKNNMPVDSTEITEKDSSKLGTKTHEIIINPPFVNEESKKPGRKYTPTDSGNSKGETESGEDGNVTNTAPPTGSPFKDLIKKRDPQGLEIIIKNNEKPKSDSLKSKTQNEGIRPPLNSKPNNPEVGNKDKDQRELIRFEDDGRYGYGYKDEAGKMVYVIAPNYVEGPEKFEAHENKIRVKKRNIGKWIFINRKGEKVEDK